MAVAEAVREARTQTAARRTHRRAYRPNPDARVANGYLAGLLIAFLPVVLITCLAWLEVIPPGHGLIGLFLAASACSVALAALRGRDQLARSHRELRQLQRLIHRAAIDDLPQSPPTMTDPLARRLAIETVDFARRAVAAREELREALELAGFEIQRRRTELARAGEEMSRLRSQSSTLQNFGGTINRQLGPAQLCGHLITGLPRELDFNHASVVLVTEGSDDLIPVAIWDKPKPALYGDFLKQVPAGHDIVCATLQNWVLQTGKTACIADATADNRCGNGTTAGRSLLAVPLRIKDHAIGVAVIAHLAPGKYGKNEEGIFASLANQTAIAIENVRLAQEAMQVAALREVNRAKSELLATVSHELRTPLASIKGYAESLLRPDVQWEEEQRREFLQIIDEESDRLGNLIEDLLQMSRIEAGILRVDLRPVKLQKLALRVAKKARAANRNLPHSYNVSFPTELPDVLADPARIEQVLRNLIENAVKYSPDGGQITVSGQVALDSAIVSVRDRGIGIAPEDLGRVFDRFYRAEGEAIQRAGGTGLGLSICRGIVEKHHGRIWAESIVGEGSVFYFSLPIAAPHPPGGQLDPDS